MPARAERIVELFPEVEMISDPALRQKVVEIWVETWQESSWADPTDLPKAEGPKGGTMVSHTRGVLEGALALAEVARKYHGVAVDLDLLVSGALLHDVSMLVEYVRTPEGVGKGPVGQMLVHGTYTVHKALAKGLPLELVNLVLTHTPRSSKPPSTLEGALIYHADIADVDARRVASGKTMWLQEHWG